MAISQVRQARSLTPSLPPPKTPADHASARVPAPGDGFEQRTADVGSLGFAEPMLSRSGGGYVHRAQPQRMTENLQHSQWSATSARGVCIFVTKKRHMLRREWRTECSNRPTRWPPPPPKAEVARTNLLPSPALPGSFPRRRSRACTRQFCRGGPENLGLVRGNITIPPHGAVSCRRAKKLPGQHVADSHLNAEGGRPGFG